MSIGLAVYKTGKQRWLLLSADARYARVQFSDARLAKAFPTPSPFVMLLRKYLDGARLSEVEQSPYERILTLTFHGGGQVVRLIAEVMGKHSNLILVGDGERILGGVKNVPPRESRVRPVFPGRPYEAPPARPRDTSIFPPGPRLDPHRDPALFREAMLAAGEAAVRPGLLGLLAGCGPFLADQIAVRAEVEPQTPIGETDADRLLAAADELYGLYETHSWKPVTFLDGRGRPDFAPYFPLGVEKVEPAEDISTAIGRSVQVDESRDALGTIRKAVIVEAERLHRAAERRAESLRAGLAAASEAEDVMQRGQLILAYQHAIAPKAAELDLPDLGMTLPLDPALTAKENAERAFRRYRKLRDARERIPGLLAEAEREAARLEDVLAFVRLAQTEGDLRDLQRDLRGEEPRQKSGREKRRGPLRFSLGAYLAVVGRSARENEEVTFRIARRDDLWLHARERTGAHVVVQGPGTPPPEIVEAAAGLAAYFSESRSDTRVDVDVAAVRDVRKISGGPPGKVTYRNFRTVRVEPGMGTWDPARRP